MQLIVDLGQLLLQKRWKQGFRKRQLQQLLEVLQRLQLQLPQSRLPKGSNITFLKQVTISQELSLISGEEIGMGIRIDKKIGIAMQHIYVPEVDLYISKEGHFYHATLLSLISENSEASHELLWLTKEEALEKIFHESHRWAIEQ